MRTQGVFGALLLLGLPVGAQDAPKVELFGGYSFATFESGVGLQRHHLNGWNSSITGNVNRWFGVTADFSGQYGSMLGVSRNVHSFLFGPRFSYRGNDRVTPSAYALFGATRAHSDPPGTLPPQTETAFSMAFGAGLDVKASQSLAIRVAQVDYLPTRFEEAPACILIVPPPRSCAPRARTQDNFRFAAGVVFRFGRR